MTGIFITGTDTGVGKTAVAAGLAGALKHRGYSVGVIKPVQSGALVRNGKLYSQDAEFLMRAIDKNDELELVCPVLLREALAPGVAARIEGKTVDIELIKNAYIELERRHDLVIVEGAGGIAVPLKTPATPYSTPYLNTGTTGTNFLISHLITCLGTPVIIVARAGLGTINHTFLTIEHARNSGIEVIGVIVNNFRGGIAEETSPRIITELTGVPILGVIPYDTKINVENSNLGNIVSLVEKNVDIEKIISFTSI